MVHWNGEEKDRPTGNGTSRYGEHSFEVPIGEIKFLPEGIRSSEDPGLTNEFKVDIDVLMSRTSFGTGCWATGILWVAVEFDAARPYVFVNGVGADGSTWAQKNAPGVLNEMEKSGVRYRVVPVDGRGSVLDNARSLQDQVQAFLDEIGSNQVHIIAHSKGGLDAQGLAWLRPPFEIVSLSTLSTPHLGSVVADLTVIRSTAIEHLAADGADPDGLASGWVNSVLGGFGSNQLGLGPQFPALLDLTTWAARDALTHGMRGNVPTTLLFAADADLNSNDKLDSSGPDEIRPLFPLVAYPIARASWELMRRYSSAGIVGTDTIRRCTGGEDVTCEWVPVLRYTLTPGGDANDIVVTVTSAMPEQFTAARRMGVRKANHSTVKHFQTIRRILESTIPMR